MRRCPTCGKRVGASRCPTHGPFEAPSVEPPAVPEIAVPGWTLTQVLGVGGFGAVFAAERDGVRAALKVARPDVPNAAARLENETQALRAVGPPHVPAVLDAGELPGGARFLAMELVPAPLLADLMAADDAPRADRFLARAQAILAALAAVHARGLVHRDLKPENVFLDEERAILIDFGLVRRVDSDSALTREGAAMGTAEYMAPEQCEGRAIDARTDVYAVGVMLYELLVGRPPFLGAEADVRQAHVSRRPPRPSRFAPAAFSVEEVLLRALAKERERRWASAAELADALMHAWAAAPSPAAAPIPTAAAAPARERRPVGLVFFASSALAEVQAALADFGGQLAHASAGQCVGAFGHETGDNPARRAFRFAEGLVARGLAARALVDLESVTVQPRPDGTRRYHSPLFARRERYPSDSDPPGVTLSVAAAAVLEDLAEGSQPALSIDGAAVVSTDVQSTGARSAAPLFGRDADLDRLVDAARAVEHGVPALATVIAEPGHGKSHLGAALLGRLRQSSKVIDLRAREPVGGDADPTLRELLVAALALPAQAPDDKGRAILAAALGKPLAGEVWPGFALAMGWVAPDAPEVRALAAAPGVLRAAAARAAGTALRTRGADQPLALVLDDAQFADEAALQALELATLPADGTPVRLFVCALARPVFLADRKGWGERAAASTLVHLGPLDAGSAADLCRRLLAPAEDIPADAIDKLVTRTQAVPLQLVELVRGLKRRGLVRRHPDRDAWYLATDELDALPDLPLVAWLAARELESLPADLAAHARLVALLGAELTVDEIVGVLAELDRAGAAQELALDPRVATQRLLAEGLLIARRQGRVSFRHALVRDAIEQALKPGERAAIHEAAFRHYEHAALPDGERLPRLALHAARSGRKVEAAAAFLTLGERAQARHAYLDAESMYSQALSELPDDDPRRADALNGRGTMRYRLGRYADAFEDFGRARALAEAAGDTLRQVELLLAEATALDWQMKFSTSRTLLEQAEALAPGNSSPVVEAGLLMARGRSHHRFQQVPEAIAALEQAVARATPIAGAYEPLVASLLLLEFLLPTVGRLEDAERCFEQVRKLCGDHGDRLHMTTALNNRFPISEARLDGAQVVRDQLEAMRLGRELGGIGAAKREYYGEYNIAECLYLQGDADGALPHARRAIEHERRYYGDSVQPVAVLLKARILAFQRVVDEARQVHDEIVAAQARAQAAGSTDALFGAVELAQLGMVDLATRAATPAEWDALLAAEVPPEIRIELLDMAARAALQHGDRARASALFASAFERCAATPNLIVLRIKPTAVQFLNNA